MSLFEVVIGENLKLQYNTEIQKQPVFQSFTNLLSAWLPNVYVVAGIIIFFYLLLGGFTMITSAGNFEKLKQGQKAITTAIVGFVIIFASFWIIQIIQIITGVPILKSTL